VEKKKARPSLRLLGIAALAVVAAIVVFSSYAIVPPGHRGVVVMLGKVETTVLGEGFHLIIPPVVRQVVPVDVRTKKLEVDSEAASSDLQTVQVTGVLNYHLDPASVDQLYQEVGVDYESIIIVPALQEAIKAATSQFKIDEILRERARLKGLIQEALRERLATNQIIVDQFSMANVDFSDEFNRAIEQKQVAEQTALQKQYELQSAQKEVEITLARAEGEKKSAIIAAEGRAQARRLEAQAEAEALKLIATELRGNDNLIKYEWATRLSPTISTVLLPADQSLILDAKSLATP
jgi:regulator of protease activity HflC (stomatin/prohibitin superfamily)